MLGGIKPATALKVPVQLQRRKALLCPLYSGQQACFMPLAESVTPKHEKISADPGLSNENTHSFKKCQLKSSSNQMKTSLLIEINFSS